MNKTAYFEKLIDDMDKQIKDFKGLRAENDRLRNCLISILSKVENGKVWAGTKWQYQGVDAVKQTQIIQIIREQALKDTK